MAGCAGLWGAFEDIVHVTLLARHVDVRSSELESCQGMVELRAFPGVGGMALGAVLAKLPVVFVVRKVACHTFLRSACVNTFPVAIFTVYVGVGAR